MIFFPFFSVLWFYKVKCWFLTSQLQQKILFTEKTEVISQQWKVTLKTWIVIKDFKSWYCESWFNISSKSGITMLKSVKPNKNLLFYIESAMSYFLSLGPFINYVKIPREGEVGKISTHSYFGEEVKPYLTYILQSQYCVIRNCAVKWFGRDHISFI